MGIVTISFLLFLIAYVLLFLGIMAMLCTDEISPKIAVMLLVGGFPVFGALSILLGVLFKLLLI